MAYQSVEEMKKVLRKATCECTAVPVCCGSAYRNKGVQSVRLDPDAGYEERLKSHIRQIRNPYCYLDGGIVVKLAFQPKGPTIEERVNSVYLSGS